MTLICLIQLSFRTSLASRRSGWLSTARNHPYSKLVELRAVARCRPLDGNIKLLVRTSTSTVEATYIMIPSPQEDRRASYNGSSSAAGVHLTASLRGGMISE